MKEKELERCLALLDAQLSKLGVESAVKAAYLSDFRKEINGAMDAVQKAMVAEMFGALYQGDADSFKKDLMKIQSLDVLKTTQIFHIVRAEALQNLVYSVKGLFGDDLSELLGYFPSETGK